MTSTLCQKPFFFVRKLKILHSSDRTILFKSNNVWRDFRLAVSASAMVNITYLIGKLIFAVNLPLKLFLATVTNADIGSLKFLHTFFKTCLYYMSMMLVKFEQNLMAQTAQNLKLFDKNLFFFLNRFDKA